MNLDYGSDYGSEHGWADEEPLESPVYLSDSDDGDGLRARGPPLDKWDFAGGLASAHTVFVDKFTV